MSVKCSLAPLCRVKDLTVLIKNPSSLEWSCGTGVETAACKFIATHSQHHGPRKAPRSRLEGYFRWTTVLEAVKAAVWQSNSKQTQAPMCSEFTRCYRQFWSGSCSATDAGSSIQVCQEQDIDTLLHRLLTALGTVHFKKCANCEKINSFWRKPSYLTRYRTNQEQIRTKI